MIKRIVGLREIAGQFDLYLVDQYGVLHDGVPIRTGIHRSLSEPELLRCCADCGGMPDFLAAAFRW